MSDVTREGSSREAVLLDQAARSGWRPAHPRSFVVGVAQDYP